MAGRGASDAHGLGGDLVDMWAVHPAGAGEAPRAVDEDPDPEALGLAEAQALDLTGLDVGALLATPDDAHVGVRRAETRGRVEGATRLVIHGSLSA